MRRPPWSSSLSGIPGHPHPEEAGAAGEPGASRSLFTGIACGCSQPGAEEREGTTGGKLGKVASSKISSGRGWVRAVLIWEVGQKQSSGRDREQPLVPKPELALPAPLASC